MLPTTGGVEEIAVKHLPNGLYFWQLHSIDHVVRSGKVIVQR